MQSMFRNNLVGKGYKLKTLSEIWMKSLFLYRGGLKTVTFPINLKTHDEHSHVKLMIVAELYLILLE